MRPCRRRSSSKALAPADPGPSDGRKTIQRKREDSDWLACIPEAHPGYISWEAYLANEQRLAANRAAVNASTTQPSPNHTVCFTPVRTERFAARPALDKVGGG